MKKVHQKSAQAPSSEAADKPTIISLPKDQVLIRGTLTDRSTLRTAVGIAGCLYAPVVIATIIGIAVVIYIIFNVL